jgi:hypothetical protein
MAGYGWTERTLNTWDWPSAAAAYKEMAENEAHNARHWKAKYEWALKQVSQ